MGSKLPMVLQSLVRLSLHEEKGQAPLPPFFFPSTRDQQSDLEIGDSGGRSTLTFLHACWCMYEHVCVWKSEVNLVSFLRCWLHWALGLGSAVLTSLELAKKPGLAGQLGPVSHPFLPPE